MRALPSTPSNPQGVLKLLQGRGISVRVATKHLAAEEAPESYKASAGLPTNEGSGHRRSWGSVIHRIRRAHQSWVQ